MSLLQVSGLHTRYETNDGVLRAVDGVSFAIEAGETVGLVGESGCGKSTLGKTLVGLVPASEGEVTFDGAEISHLSPAALKPVRRRLQMIFQDPFGSLNPRQSIGQILTAPLAVHGVRSAAERRAQALAMVRRVGLPDDTLQRFPHEFSGGQRQRIGVARALILAPQLVVCDEPVSALDLSIQAQILNLLVEMKSELDLAYLFVSHDLSVVRYFADRVLVMYLGRIVESATYDTIWSRPRHPYTRALMEAVPDPLRRRTAAPLSGDLPSARNVPSGCRFHPRCPFATDLCRSADPALRSVEPGHEVACHHAEAIFAAAGATPPGAATVH
ncbi:MAG: ATP-binding cassette domain-containing protein [Bauldia sp.]|nr:ATP-binding cassette domain-containing protein [Bauldia sp.]